MNETSSGFKSELRISPNLVTALLMLSGLLLVFVSGSLSDMSERFRVAVLAILIYALSGIGWLLGNWRPRLCRWFVVIAVVVLVSLVSGWLSAPGSQTLLVIPTALAAALISLPAAAITATGETAFLLLSHDLGTNAEAGTLWVALAAIWLMLGVMYAVYSPIHRLSAELWEYFQRAEGQVEEARDQRVELKQALEDLTHANRQLALINERLAALRLIAEEAQKTKAAFVAKVSHELRTPLNMIIALVDLLVETPEVYGQKLPPALLEDLTIVHRNCEHLSSMVNDVLALSQAEVGRLTLQRQQASFPEIIAGALEVVRPLVEKKKLSLQVDIPGDLPEVYCDRTRIRQVILNLVSNAARFTEEGGIRIRVMERDGGVIASVTDTGPGIPPEDAERVFEPFWQGRSSLWGEKGGSGLGLSISKQLIEMHGGRIWLETEPGVGSTFSFELPTAEPVAPASRPGHWLIPDWAWVRHGSRKRQPNQPPKPRVVICDAAGDLSPGLSQYSDRVEFVDTRDLAQATQELQQCPAQAVVVNAPTPSELSQLIEQARHGMPDTPIIGCSVPRRGEQAQQAGAIGYLMKPLTRRDLEEAIRAVGRPVRRILVVDDDPDVLRLLTRLLHALDPAMEVAAVPGGEQALGELRSRLPDLMLLDVMMPGMDGWQVLAAKDSEERLRELPVILVSASDVTQQPQTSPVLLAAMDKGLSVSQVLRCSLELSALLLEPEIELDPGLV